MRTTMSLWLGSIVVVLLVAIVVAVLVARRDGDPSTGESGLSAQAEATSTATVASSSTPLLTPTQESPGTTPDSRDELVLRQQGFITARGFYPGEPHITTTSSGERLFAYRSLCAFSVTLNHNNCQVVHFFLEDTYLGTDTYNVYYGYEEIAQTGDGQVTVMYTTYAPGDGECCPSVSEEVTYSWTGDRLAASGEPPPPRGTPVAALRNPAAEPGPLHIVTYGAECAPGPLTVPSGAALTVVFTNGSGEPQSFRILGTDFRTPVIEGFEQASLEVVLARRDTPYTYDCGSGQSEIQVVAPLDGS